MLVPTVIAGVVLGFTYGLLALTLVLLVKTTGVLNFATAAFATMFAFAAYEFDRAGAPHLATLLLTFLFAAIAAATVYLVVILPRAGSPLHLSLRTLGLLIVVGAVLERIWGPHSPYSFPHLIPDGGLELAGLQISNVQLFSIGFALLIAAALGTFTAKSRLGLLVRSVAADRAAAKLLGVNVVKVDLVVWVIAALVSACVGILYAQQSVLTPDMTAPVLLAAFAAAQIADMKSMPVALTAGVVLGVAQSLSTVYFNQPAWSQLLSFAVLVIALLYRSGISRRLAGVTT